MTIYLCPGYHSPTLTDRFIETLGLNQPQQSHPQTPENPGQKNLSRPLSKPLNKKLIVFPSDRLPPYSPQAILQYLRQSLDQFSDQSPDQASRSPQTTSITWIAFSAGVVGGILAARQWQQAGYRVEKFIAIDGWGMPLGQDFPIYRLSHDRWTNHSQTTINHLLGSGIGDRPVASFIADPAVDHLSLWRSPDQVTGYLLNPQPLERSRTQSPLSQKHCTAADCLKQWLPLS